MLRQLELAQHYQTLLNLYCNKLRIKKVRICKRRHDLVHDEGNSLKVNSRYAFFDSVNKRSFLYHYINMAFFKAQQFELHQSPSPLYQINRADVLCIVFFKKKLVENQLQRVNPYNLTKPLLKSKKLFIIHTTHYTVYTAQI